MYKIKFKCPKCGQIISIVFLDEVIECPECREFYNFDEVGKVLEDWYE